MRPDRTISLVVAARFISRLGGTAAFFVGVWGIAAYTFSASPRELAWVMTASALAGMVGSMLAGVLVDRVGPRWVMIAAELLTIPVVLALSQSGSLVELAGWNALFAFVGMPTFTAGASFAPYVTTGKAGLERVNSLIEGAGSLGFVLGPAVGAAVVEVADVRAVMYVMVAAAIASAALVWLARVPREPLGVDDVANGAPEAASAARAPRALRESGFQQLKNGLRLTYQTRSLRYFVLMGTVIWLGFGAFSALEPLFYRDVVGVGPEWIGWMNTVFGAGLVLGAWLLPRLPERVVSARGLAVFAGTIGVATCFYVGSDRLAFIAVGALVWGTVIGAAMPLLNTLIQLDAPGAYVGRVMGALRYHQNAAELVPLAIAPAAAAAFGVQAVLIAAGLVVAALSFGSWRTAASIDRADESVTALPAESPTGV